MKSPYLFRTRTPLGARPDAARPLHRRPAAICAWCPGFNPRDPANRGVSHTMCAACFARLKTTGGRR